ncbi:telomere-associated protein Tap [Streptomyces albus]|uniref:telomere-associated protein Tap n=1 Tax=Streptomyces albus TaxID=1888 RepID=UPI0004CC1C31|nr:helix-turn-helix domain-containing protein [Streptomyces albus]
MSELFEAVDALVERRGTLPPPAERERLRKAHGLTREQVAEALGVRRATVVNWEAGRTEPRPPQRQAYVRLLDRLAALHPAPAGPAAPAAGGAVPPASAGTPGPAGPAASPEASTSPAAPASAASPGPAASPAAAGPAAAAAPGAPTDASGPVGPVAPPASPAHAGSSARPASAGTSAPAGPGASPVPSAPAGSAVPTGPADSGGTGEAPSHRHAVAPAGPVPSARPREAARPAGSRASGGPSATTAAGSRAQPRLPAADRPFADGPLVVLDGDGTAYGVGGLVLECPARTVPELVEWALREARLGAERLHPAGRDADPLVVLTDAAAARLGLPPELEDRRTLRLPADHPVVRTVTGAGWRLTRRGFGPWPRIYRPAAGGRRQCVQLAVLPFGALDPRSWPGAASLPAPRLAQVLGDYAARVLTPRGSCAVNGLELMTALRPPTRPVREERGERWVPGPVPGSLTSAVDPAPPEAPEEHPVAAGRPEGQVLDEEACDWIRDPQLLTDAECGRVYAVGLDVNMAFAAAANRLPVGLGAPVHVREPRFDKKLPGCWYADLSGIEIDPRLPNPFTPHGDRPDGPAWYATPTLAYAAELGHDVRPSEAWIRPEHGPYLDPWYQRLRDAYLATMERLGVTPGMPEADFLAAMERHQEADPGQAAVLSAVKATVKGGIGKLRERPQGRGHRPGERWPALERPTWRPDIRAAVIASARVNMHRKMRKLAEGAGLYPVAVLSDCAVYLADGPSPLDVLPRTPEGAPLPGGFRLGVNPGMVKHEGTRPLLWAAELLDAGHNPARHIRTGGAGDGEE